MIPYKIPALIRLFGTKQEVRGTVDITKIRRQHQTFSAPTPAVHHNDRGAGGMCQNEMPAGPVSRNEALVSAGMSHVLPGWGRPP